MYSKVKLRIDYPRNKVMAQEFVTKIVPGTDSAEVGARARAEFMASDEFKQYGQAHCFVVQVSGTSPDDWPAIEAAAEADFDDEARHSGIGCVEFLSDFPDPELDVEPVNSKKRRSIRK